ncbi:396_t:CDS:2, partial [Dentiscutata erythropus]
TKFLAIETNEENPQKRNADLAEIENSSGSEEYATNKVGKSNSHYEAICYYCVPKKSWARGKPAKLEAHLTNECPNCPKTISRYWREKVATRNSNYIQKRTSTTLPNQPAITSHFLSDHPLPKAAINHLDQKITKAWVIAGILFEIIENPFIKDMFKEFLLAYNSLSRTTLSDQLLDKEIARINCAVDNDIDKADHLTLDFVRTPDYPTTLLINDIIDLEIEENSESSIAETS